MQDIVVIGGECSLSEVIDGSCGLSIMQCGETGVFTPVYPPAYEGETHVTPSSSTQILQTEGLMVGENITIDPIPENYGLITWNGSSLTVS